MRSEKLPKKFNYDLFKCHIKNKITWNILFTLSFIILKKYYYDEPKNFYKIHYNILIQYNFNIATTIDVAKTNEYNFIIVL